MTRNPTVFLPGEAGLLPGEAGAEEGLAPGGAGADAALVREWIETDGLGGFSSSTISLARTRCYHAILNPAVHPPLGRMVLWATMDERLTVGGESCVLGAHHVGADAEAEDGAASATRGLRPGDPLPIGRVLHEGHRRLVRFDARPIPRWTYQVGGGRLVRELVLVHGVGDVFVAYSWHGGEPAELTVRPYLAFRDHHEVARRFSIAGADATGVETAGVEAAGAEATGVEAAGVEVVGVEAVSAEAVAVEAVGTVDCPAPDRCRIRFRGDEPVLRMEAPGAEFRNDPTWLENLALPVETYRGLPDREDLWAPGEFAFTLEPGRTVWIRAGVAGDDAAPGVVTASDAAADHAADADAAPGTYEDTRAREVARRDGLALDFLSALPGLEPLAVAADQFLVKRGDKNTVIAGYPWFTDWGRDTMIALPGLTLATGRLELAQELILTFVEHMRDGLIPNRFPDEGELPEYNTVDATLWLAVALRHTWRATDNMRFVRSVLPALRLARERHEEGTRYGIHVDGDGLLESGEGGTQLTWMDAKVDDWVVTPRVGKPVEIQALWYNFLMIGWELEQAAANARAREEREKAEDGGGGSEPHAGGPDPGPSAEAESWRAAAKAARASFERFWDPERGYLADGLRPDGTLDWSVRPNQLLALSLPHPLVNENRARSILRLTREKLLTPRGLRSLEPGRPEYHARYGGDRRTRDGAYHQGTVWGWLHGPYLEAVLRFEGDAGHEEVRRVLEGWVAHLAEGCVGQGAEVFDGDPPHAPRGCPAQAWTVAEALRIARMLVRDTDLPIERGD